MDRRTQTIIAGTIVLLGIGVVGLGFIEGETGVRYVAQMHEDPWTHMEGSFTLIGEVQPRILPGGNGTANPDWKPAITWSHREAIEGTVYLHTNELRAVQQNDGSIQWTLSSWSQRTDRSAPEADPVVQEWTSEGTLFQVKDFESGQSLWAVTQTLPGELFVKPSQMEGRIIASPAVPEGALVFEVDSMTQQCSSKFIPEDLRDKYDPDGNGITD